VGDIIPEYPGDIMSEWVGDFGGIRSVQPGTLLLVQGFASGSVQDAAICIGELICIWVGQVGKAIQPLDLEAAESPRLRSGGDGKTDRLNRVAAKIANWHQFIEQTLHISRQ